MRIFYLFLLFSSLGFTQINPLELKINAISVSDSIRGVRIFKVDYHIKNTIDKDVTFINSIYPLNRLYPDVKNLLVHASIIENEKKIHQSVLQKNIKFIQYKSNLDNAISEADKKIIIEEFVKTLTKDSTATKIERERILKINDFDYVKSAITTIKPHEIRNFTETYYWNKVRYYKQDELEYYIDENTPYFLQLSMNFPKDEFKYFFSDEEFKKIKSNPNFIDGSLVSNRMEINFKE